MMVIITGTPGTGKTTVSKLLADKIKAKLISINGLLEEYDLNLGIDDARGYKIVDTKRMIPIVDGIKDECNNETVVFEGHIAQDYPNGDKIIVLRCNPDILKTRLDKRNWKDKKVQENIEAEILGICTSESYETYGDIVQEIDASNKTPNEVVDNIIEIIENKKEYPAGVVDYLTGYFGYLT